MGILFISHSSKNNERAIRVRDWLREQGWRDTFLDLDPEHGLAPGQRWQDELKKAGARCSAVIVLVSPDWVASRWCVTEFQLATMLDKLVFPVLIAPTPFTDLPPELTAHVQMADMSRPEIEADGLNRLRIGLTRAGLHPGHFPWPPPGEPNRPPYRGLHTLEEPDAAIFFGRDALIAKGLEALRQMRSGAPERMLVVLGASGAGKSSFLRAGLLARLQRDEESFLVLPLLRPARAALSGPTGLAHALGLSGPFTAEAIAARFAALRAPVVDRLTRYAHAGRETYTARPPTLILPIDQGEELFAAEQKEAGGALAALAAAFAADENLLAIVTIRSDGFAALQAERTLAAIPRLPLDLPALSPTSFKEVVEGPGHLAQPPIKVEEALTSQLVADLDRADALPLLAFTLERLVQDHRADGVLMLDKYQKSLGGLEGAIKKAVEAAFLTASKDHRLPIDRAELEQLARSVFIPWLVRLEHANSVPQRRVATMAELPAAAQPLIRHVINQRLLVSAEREDGETTVEVSHEAVLRHWPLLVDNWLGEEGEELAWCESVMRAAGDWRRDIHRTGEEADLLLVHRGKRLAKAESLLVRDDLTRFIGIDAQKYLDACRQAENNSQENIEQQGRRHRRLKRRLSIFVLIALLVTIGGTSLVILGEQRRSYQSSRALASEARTASQAARYDQAARLSILAARSTWRQPAGPEGEIELGRAAFFSRLTAALSGHTSWTGSASFSQDGASIVTASGDGTARVWHKRADGSWSADHVLRLGDTELFDASFSQDGTRIVTASGDGTARVWRQQADGNWSADHVLRHGDTELFDASFSQDGTRIVTASGDGTARVWHQQADGSWSADTVLRHGGTELFAASFSQDGTRIVTASAGTVRVWGDGSGGAKLIANLSTYGRCVSASFSSENGEIFTAETDGSVLLWQEGKAGDWNSEQIIPGESEDAVAAAFSPNRGRIAITYSNGTTRLWHQEEFGYSSPVLLAGHDGPVNSASFSLNGNHLVTTSDDWTARVWDAVPEKPPSSIIFWKETPIGRNGATSASFSKDGRSIVTSHSDGEARVWHKDIKGNWFNYFRLDHGDAKVFSTALSPEGRAAVVATSQNSSAIIWQEKEEGILSATSAGTATVWLWHEDPEGVWLPIALDNKSDKINSVMFSPDGNRIAAGSADGKVYIWTYTAKEALSRKIFEPHAEGINDLSFSVDGKCVLTGSDDGTAQVWCENADGTWGARSILNHDNIKVLSANFSPDGDRIVTGNEDGIVLVWREGVKGVWRSSELGKHGDRINSASFSPDGSRIVTASENRSVGIWYTDADGRWSNIALLGHDRGVNSAYFSSDGTSVVSASKDGSARLWEVAWLIGDSGRAWANKYDASLVLEPLVQAVCTKKLLGSELTLLDESGKEFGRNGVRRLSIADTDVAPLLRGREGENVCTWQPSLLDQWLNWAIRDLWSSN